MAVVVEHRIVSQLYEGARRVHAHGDPRGANLHGRPHLVFDEPWYSPHRGGSGSCEGLARSDRRLRHVSQRVVAQRCHRAVDEIPLVDERVVVVLKGL